MTLERKWIQAATIAVDTETGALLVTGIEGGGGYEVVGLKNAAGTRVNPATETTLASMLSAMSTLSGSGLTFGRTYFSDDAGPVTIVAASSGQIARLHGLAVVCSAEATLTIKDSDDATLYVLGTFAANGGIVLDPVAMAVLAYAEAAAGKGLKLTTNAGTMTGYVLYSQQEAT